LISKRNPDTPRVARSDALTNPDPPTLFVVASADIDFYVKEGQKLWKAHAAVDTWHLPGIHKEALHDCSPELSYTFAFSNQVVIVCFGAKMESSRLMILTPLPSLTVPSTNCCVHPHTPDTREAADCRTGCRCTKLVRVVWSGIWFFYAQALLLPLWHGLLRRLLAPARCDGLRRQGNIYIVSTLPNDT